MKKQQKLTPELFLQQQQKTAFVILACLGVCLLAHQFHKKTDKKESGQQKQVATVIHHQTYSGNHPSPIIRFLLDTDGNKDTAESVCDIPAENIHPLNADDLKQILPIGTTRTIWEWQKLGHVSKFCQH